MSVAPLRLNGTIASVQMMRLAFNAVTPGSYTTIDTNATANSKRADITLCNNRWL